MFNVGDRVMCANHYDSNGHLTAGKIYTVSKTPDPFQIGSPTIMLKELEGKWFFVSRFILAINEQSPYIQWEKGNVNA